MRRHLPPACLALALALALGATACSGTSTSTTTALPPSPSTAAATAATTATSSSGPTGSPSSASSPSSLPPPARTADPPSGSPLPSVTLDGADLGVTRVGAPFAQAQQRLTAALGAPTADPKQSVTCINAEREVAWGDFTAAQKGGMLAGWSTTTTRFRTSAGVRVGSPVANVKQAYGARLQLFPANTDGGPSFSVRGMDLLGGLSSSGADARVTRLFTGACSGP